MSGSSTKPSHLLLHVSRVSHAKLKVLTFGVYFLDTSWHSRRARESKSIVLTKQRRWPGWIHFELLFFFFNNNINPFMKVEPSWPNYLWKVTLPNALGIKFGRAKAMSVDYSCLPLRFLEFVKLCQIHSCNFWLCKSTGYFQFGAKWRQVNMRPCQYHFSDQLKSLIEGKG